MGKKVWFGVVLLSVSAVAAVVYANYQAKQQIADYIEQSNLHYAQLAGQDNMPEIQMSYTDLSANVLTSSYSMEGLKISIVGTGELLNVGKVNITGLKPNTLAEQGTALLQDIRLAPAALDMLPAELADYLSALQMELSYQYQYSPGSGVLVFQQKFGVDQSFSMNYSFAVSGVTKLWQFAEQLQKLTPQQQQQQAEQADYMADLMQIVAEVGIEKGSLEITNNRFLQQLLDTLAQSELSPDYAGAQQHLTQALQQNQQIPELIRQPVLAFVQQPEHLTLSFQLPQPLTFAQMQNGTALEGIETLEDFFEYADLTLSANKN